ncbi:hypothetical protein [Streptomyces thermocarboxydus]|uniref:hypothetical protein n=1 Tax=Streptomyces thermocarboxydus TaxID=59299 RepID=UPI003B51373A
MASSSRRASAAPAGCRSRAEGGVGEAGVGVLEPPCGLLGGAARVGGLGEQRRLAFELTGARGDAGGVPACLRQLLLQRGSFEVEAFAVTDAGGGADAASRWAAVRSSCVAFGGAQLLLGACSVEAAPARGRTPAPPRRVHGELVGRVSRRRGRGGQLLPYGAEPLGFGARGPRRAGRR